jgi:hypothetical protein
MLRVPRTSPRTRGCAGKASVKFAGDRLFLPLRPVAQPRSRASDWLISLKTKRNTLQRVPGTQLELDGERLAAAEDAHITNHFRTQEDGL